MFSLSCINENIADWEQTVHKCLTQDSPLSHLKPQPSQLSRLNLHSNKLASMDPLVMSSFSQLVFLDLSSNCIRDIDGLSNLTKLKYLNLSNNFIESLEGLRGARLEKLEWLLLSYNNISSLEPLQTMHSSRNQLRHLEVQGNALAQPETFMYLMSFTQLRFLFVSETETIDGLPVNPICRAKTYPEGLWKLLPQHLVALDCRSRHGGLVHSDEMPDFISMDDLKDDPILDVPTSVPIQYESVTTSTADSGVQTDTEKVLDSPTSKDAECYVQPETSSKSSQVEPVLLSTSGVQCEILNLSQSSSANAALQKRELEERLDIMRSIIDRQCQEKESSAKGTCQLREIVRELTDKCETLHRECAKKDVSIHELTLKIDKHDEEKQELCFKLSEAEKRALSDASLVTQTKVSLEAVTAQRDRYSMQLKSYQQDHEKVISKAHRQREKMIATCDQLKQDNEIFKRTIAHLEDDCRRTRDQMRIQNDEHSGTLAKLRGDHEEDVARLRHTVTEHAVNGFEAERSILLRKLDTAQERVNQLETSLSKLKQDSQEVNRQLKSENDKLIRQNAEQSDTIRNHKSREEKVNGLMSELGSTVTMLQKKLEFLEKERDIFRRKHHMTVQELEAKVYKASPAANDEVRAQCQQLQKNLDHANQKTTDLESQMNSKECSLQAQLRAANTRASDLEQVVETWQLKRGEMEEKISSLHSVIKVKDSMLDDQNDSLRKLKQEIASVKLELETSKRKSEATAQKLERELLEKNSDNDELEKILKQIDAVNRKLESNEDTLTEKCQTLTNTVEEVKGQLDERDDMIALIEQEITQMKDSITNKFQNQIEALNKDLSVAQSSRDELSQELKITRSQLEETASSKLQVDAALREAHRKVLELDTQITVLTDEIDKNKKASDVRMAQLRSLLVE